MVQCGLINLCTIYPPPILLQVRGREARAVVVVPGPVRRVPALCARLRHRFRGLHPLHPPDQHCGPILRLRGYHELDYAAGDGRYLDCHQSPPFIRTTLSV